MEGFAGPDQLRQLFAAVLAIASDLDLEAMLSRITEAAAELAHARYAALGVLDEGRESLSAFITVGIDDATRATIGEPPRGHGILGTLIKDPRPLRLPDLHAHPDTYGFPPNHPPMTSFLGVPILIRGEAFGNLYLCDKLDGGGFTDIDEELMVALAASAGVAIENARLHTRVSDIARFADRDRIARDLHDTVIQRLFAVGLSLQGTVRLATDPTLVERLEGAVDELDTTVREIRSAIFELHAPHQTGRSVRQAAIALCVESARTLGFEPTVRFEGPIDTAVDDRLAEHLLAVQREALSNVAKHASATAVSLTLTAADGLVSLLVEDNGTGPVGDAAASSGPGIRTIGAGRGLDNMLSRAQELGGRFSLESREGGGTTLLWTVPSH